MYTFIILCLYVCLYIYMMCVYIYVYVWHLLNIYMCVCVGVHVYTHAHTHRHLLSALYGPHTILRTFCGVSYLICTKTQGHSETVTGPIPILQPHWGLVTFGHLPNVTQIIRPFRLDLTDFRICTSLSSFNLLSVHLPLHHLCHLTILSGISDLKK